jgi:hypothetical protein
MNQTNARSARLLDLLLIVAASTSTSLGLLLLTLSLSMGADNLLDQLLRQRGWPSTLVLALVGFGIAAACGAAYTVVGAAGDERPSLPD